MVNNVRLEFSSKTDPGLVRPRNEDAIALSPDYGFAVLADGMGGYSAGEVASGIATAVFKQFMEQGLDCLQSQPADPLSTHSRQMRQLMLESIQQANSAILAAARVEPRYHGMGTTLVAALFHNDKIIVAHVGDSRAYRFRRGEIAQITRDHSLLQEQIDAGLISPEWAPFSQYKNLVTRAVGVDQVLEVEIHEHPVEPGDVYLLCSDGLSDMLATGEMRDILNIRGRALDVACDALVQRANDKGGHDNISVVLIKTPQAQPKMPGWLGKILNRFAQ